MRSMNKYKSKGEDINVSESGYIVKLKDMGVRGRHCSSTPPAKLSHQTTPGLRKTSETTNQAFLLLFLSLIFYNVLNYKSSFASSKRKSERF